jgi:hypothetical protein
VQPIAFKATEEKKE